jgi:uncharacterized protein (TIGR03067 family)
MTKAMAALAISCLATAVAAQDGDSAKDLKQMAGTWSGTFVEAGGKPIPAKEKTVRVKLVVKGDKYTVFIDEAKFADGQIKLDASKKPRAIDAIAAGGPLKGQVQPGIYQVSADEIRVVFSTPGSDRPTAFKTKEGTQEALVVYKRVKDAK